MTAAVLGTHRLSSAIFSLPFGWPGLEEEDYSFSGFFGPLWSTAVAAVAAAAGVAAVVAVDVAAIAAVAVADGVFPSIPSVSPTWPQLHPAL